MHSLIRFDRTAIVCLVMLLLLCFPDSATACPNCKDALEISRAIAFGASVLFLMSMPFSIAAVWAVALYKNGKQHRSGDQVCSSCDGD